MSEEAEIIDAESKTAGLTRFRSASALPLSSQDTESPNAAGHDFGWAGLKAASISVASVAPIRSVTSALSNLEIAPGTPGFGKSNWRSPTAERRLSETIFKAPVDPNAPYSFPGRPQIVSRTHFEVVSNFYNNIPTNLIEHMNKTVLPKFDSYDFSDFDRDGGMWHGKYIRGATCCDVDVLVYSDRKSGNCIIEVNKTKGDSKPYVQFFKDLKAQFVAQTEAPKQSTPLFNFGSLSCSMISDEDYLKGLQPVFRMAAAANFEARLEAAKMLCDLFQQRQTQLQNDKVREACIKCVDTLVHDGFPDVQQFAIMAMSLMAEVDQHYKMDLIKCSALLLVVKKVVDNPNPTLNFETIQTRRECAKILMTLASDNNGPALKASIIEKAGMGGTAFLQDWMNQVRTLTDYRLKTQTAKAFPEMTLA